MRPRLSSAGQWHQALYGLAPYPGPDPRQTPTNWATTKLWMPPNAPPSYVGLRRAPALGVLPPERWKARQAKGNSDKRLAGSCSSFCSDGHHQGLDAPERTPACCGSILLDTAVALASSGRERKEYPVLFVQLPGELRSCQVCFLQACLRKAAEAANSGVVVRRNEGI